MTQKIAYLTIDDAPSKDFRKKVDFLIKNSIPAVFFCIGKEMENSEKDLIYAIKNGFVIGNHAFNHKHFSDLTLKECIQEIQKTEKIIEEIYKKSGIERPVKLFRFPFLDKGGHKNSKESKIKRFAYTNFKKKQKIQDYLKKLGYVQPKFKEIEIKWFNESKLLNDVDVFMTFDQMEYLLNRKDAPYGLSNERAILARINEDYPEEGRSLNNLKTADIIMIHDHENTTRLFFKIITRYLNKGIRFKLPKF